MILGLNLMKPKFLFLQSGDNIYSICLLEGLNELIYASSLAGYLNSLIMVPDWLWKMVPLPVPLEELVLNSQVIYI